MKLVRQLAAISRCFVSDQHGTIALIFAFCASALLVIAGLAIDGARTYNVSFRVGAALDAAALTGAALLFDTNQTDAQVQAAIQSTLNAEHAKLGIGGVSVAAPTITLDRANSAVTVSAGFTIQTLFGVFAGAPTLTLNKSATTNYQLAKLEVVLALDITGSMNSIPTGDTQTKIATLIQVATDVVNSLYDQAQTDTNIRIGLVPWSASVNAGRYAHLVTGESSISGWTPPAWGSSAGGHDNCVVERFGTADVTDVPLGTNTYANPLPNGGTCPPSPILPLIGRTQRSTLISAIDGLSATGSTAGHIGTAWGWYLISPNWANYFPSGSQPDAYHSATVKNVIVLTDGIFNTDYVGGTRSGAYDDTSYTLFQQNCSGMRAVGINVYTIALDLTDATAVSELQSCAGAVNNFFTANNAATLNAAFAAIIKKMTTVRVSK